MSFDSDLLLHVATDKDLGSRVLKAWFQVLAIPTNHRSLHHLEPVKV